MARRAEAETVESSDIQTDSIKVWSRRTRQEDQNECTRSWTMRSESIYKKPSKNAQNDIRYRSKRSNTQAPHHKHLILLHNISGSYLVTRNSPRATVATLSRLVGRVNAPTRKKNVPSQVKQFLINTFQRHDEICGLWVFCRKKIGWGEKKSIAVRWFGGDSEGVLHTIEVIPVASIRTWPISGGDRVRRGW